MPANGISLAEFWRELPPEWLGDCQTEIRQMLQQLDTKVVVVDDDPTGTQTVHGVPVLTEWPVDCLLAELKNNLPAFYILTNSRSMTRSEACSLSRQVAGNLSRAASLSGRKFVVVSRSDSTLRGHFPSEVEALIEGLDRKPEAVLLIPFFGEGGRFTRGDVHYVAEGDRMIPAGQTEFAKDPTFGYRASDLREWVEEKTDRRVPMDSVESISLDEIRLGGPDTIVRRLKALKRGAVCVVNCVAGNDLEVFTLGLLKAELAGKHFLCRTAASFVAVRSGIGCRPLLTQEQVSLGENGGLIVVGSYVSRTTAQLHALLREAEVEGLELNVPALLESGRRDVEISRVALHASRQIADGKDVVIFTSRKLVVAQSAEESLTTGQSISAALVDVVRSMDIRPRYLLAKGGITSSDLASRALNVKRAMVLGQVLPGVPVWELGPESRYPGLPYVAFPGNVGDAESVARIVRQWRRCRSTVS